MSDHQVVHQSGEIVTRSAGRLGHVHGGAAVQYAAGRDEGVQGKVLRSYGADEYPVRGKDVEAPGQVVACPEGVTRQDPQEPGVLNSPGPSPRPPMEARCAWVSANTRTSQLEPSTTPTEPSERTGIRPLSGGRDGPHQRG